MSELLGRRSGRVLVVLPAVALTLTLALTGCGKLGAAGSSGPSGASGSPASTGAAPSTVSSPAATPDSSTLDSISQDLGAADAANSQADSNGQAADQAAATGDEP